MAAVPSAAVIGSVGPSLEYDLVPGDVMAGARGVESFESAEYQQATGQEDRFGRVEVFRMDGVGTSIFGRPRRLSWQRFAVSGDYLSALSFTKSKFVPS